MHRAVGVFVVVLATMVSMITPAAAWDGPLCALDTALSSVPDDWRMREPEPEPNMCAYDGAVTELATPVVAREELGLEHAQRALNAYRAQREAGQYDHALASLDLLEAATPELADRWALLRGQLLLDADRPADAVAQFVVARESLDSAVRAHARVGRVRALIRSHDREAASELTALRRFYPSLPEAQHLRFELAVSYEESDVDAAVRIYRDIDLSAPGSALAAQSRAHMDALRARGVPVRELTRSQEVARCETLVSRGPMDQAKVEVERLLAFEDLTNDQRARVARGAARIARIEGRWDDAERYMRMAIRAPLPSDTEDREREEFRRADVLAAAATREQESARQRILQLKGRRPWARVPDMRLRQIIEIGARAGLADEVNQALAGLRQSRNIHPITAFESALLAAGTGNDEHVAALFASVIQHPSLGVEAQYHYARTLERLGRWVDAEIQFLRVIQRDRSETRWYALLSEQRLWTVREAMLCRCGPEEMERRAIAEQLEGEEPLVLASLNALPTRSPSRHREGTIENAPLVPPRELDVDGLATRLDALAEEHGDGYPFFERAATLLRLGEKEAATDELHEAYLGWRDARGRTQRRSGLEAVFRGEEAPRAFVDPATRRARRKLDGEAKSDLVEIASILGDEGIAVGMEGWSRAQERPRAYEDIVTRVARHHDLDPNLLLAVMRVESVFQRRIVSYAGAVGLMQIMPRTGRLIADALGRDDFTTDDLLDPETNIEFAAWYLRSLIDRWDGRLPLAIASYNGGPHNVRRWLRDHGENMPLDAFLERIPFDQTHRYVRRVLGHYAVYRAQQGLPMERLNLHLPDPGPDPIAF